MYTIKLAALRSGLPVATVRAWERRYEVVRPTRTTSGYRLYDDDAIARLIAMRQLVDVRGLRPSQAAEQIRSDPGVVARLVADAAPDVAGVTGGGVSPEAAAVTVAAFVEATRRLDVAAMERSLDESFAAERFEAAVEHVVFPALRTIGDGWASGEIDVAMEHAASETIRRRLAHYFDAAGGAVDATQVIVGLPPGARHEIGALAFAVAARRAGLHVLYLGADVPLESWRAAATTTDATVAVIGVTSRSDARSATAVIGELRAADTPIALAVGGASAHALGDPQEALALSDGIENAVTEVRALVAGRA